MPQFLRNVLARFKQPVMLRSIISFLIGPLGKLKPNFCKHLILGRKLIALIHKENKGIPPSNERVSAMRYVAVKLAPWLLDIFPLPWMYNLPPS